MNPKLWARVAHLVDGKAVHQRPAYYELIKFAVEKEAEINFDEEVKRFYSEVKGHNAVLLR